MIKVINSQELKQLQEKRTIVQLLQPTPATISEVLKRNPKALLLFLV